MNVLKIYLVSGRRNGNAHFFRVRSVNDHVAGYLAPVERDVHPLSGHQPEVGQRAKSRSYQFGGPVLASPGRTVVETYRVTGLGAVRGRFHRGYDARTQFTVVAGWRTNARPDNGPLGQPFAAGARDRAVLLPHSNRQRRVQFDDGGDIIYLFLRRARAATSEK